MGYIKQALSFLKNENGSTSILIILMMVVLVSMGYFALATASANTRLSAVAADWKSNFFYLDGQGKKFTAHVDGLLLLAQESANEYFTSESYRNFTHPDLTLEMQTFIREGYESANDQEAFVEEVINMLFFLYADRELLKLSEVYPDVVVSALRDVEGDFDVVLGLVSDITLTHPLSPDFHLSITLSVNSYSSFRAAHRAGNTRATRYRVTGWLQWQSQEPEGEPGTGLWDGRIELP